MSEPDTDMILQGAWLVRALATKHASVREFVRYVCALEAARAVTPGGADEITDSGYTYREIDAALETT